MPDALADYVASVARAAEMLRARTHRRPRVGLILGSGLGALADEIDGAETVAYDAIPGFARSTVTSHAGNLLFGTLAGVDVVAMQGRVHLYEGYDAREVTFPVRVMAHLGVKTLVLSNAAGGLNPLYRRGEMMLVTDHINLQGDNPLIGPNHDAWGPRFPDMSAAYDPALRALLRETAEKLGGLAFGQVLDVAQQHGGAERPGYGPTERFGDMRVGRADDDARRAARTRCQRERDLAHPRAVDRQRPESGGAARRTAALDVPVPVRDHHRVRLRVEARWARVGLTLPTYAASTPAGAEGASASGITHGGA